ncbi:MAG: Dam family site-specific DNA-(adenine-N6)-methyltransferase [Dehalococcoidia bacterium]|nr:Dam family site-specific DNA-(adenine-N6)-methyltransferase [Dehalococcoidia bacterium]
MAPLRDNAPVAAPFLKWAGGKAKLVPEILARAPAAFGRYHEPFLGGGAVFFALERLHPGLAARLSDGNADLVATYRAVRDEVDGVVAALRVLEARYFADDPECRAAVYYSVRGCVPADPDEAAARTIFLNRTGYNGLYRVNSSGRFNVPHGRYKRPRILHEERLRAASAALAHCELDAEDFEAACEAARPGDFVYLDPPYYPLTATARFTNYTRESFGLPEQERLRDAFDRLTARGVAALLSNSDHPVVRELYGGRGYTLDQVTMSRAINSKGTGRAPIAELLIGNLGRAEVCATLAGMEQRRD